MRKLVSKLRPLHILLCCLSGLVLLGSIFLSQRQKLDEINEQYETLRTQHEQLLLEEERLSHMVEYAQTDEYLAQLAREKFGYVAPGDYKFYLTEPNE